MAELRELDNETRSHEGSLTPIKVKKQIIMACYIIDQAFESLYPTDLAGRLYSLQYQLLRLSKTLKCVSGPSSNVLKVLNVTSKVVPEGLKNL